MKFDIARKKLDPHIMTTQSDCLTKEFTKYFNRIHDFKTLVNCITTHSPESTLIKQLEPSDRLPSNRLCCLVNTDNTESLARHVLNHDAVADRGTAVRYPLHAKGRPVDRRRIFG